MENVENIFHVKVKMHFKISLTLPGISLKRGYLLGRLCGMYGTQKQTIHPCVRTSVIHEAM
jgi:hypothetical protein